MGCKCSVKSCDRTVLLRLCLVPNSCDQHLRPVEMAQAAVHRGKSPESKRQRAEDQRLPALETPGIDKSKIF